MADDRFLLRRIAHDAHETPNPLALARGFTESEERRRFAPCLMNIATDRREPRRAESLGGGSGFRLLIADAEPALVKSS
ncbi:hypothetical protein LLS1_02870 [Leifsonia sp. LS1]|nr:hypothetical protein LLS1_02870 [Leifsonia sp. LS1]